MTEYELTSYLFNIPHRLRGSAIVFIITFFFVLPVAIQKDIWHAPLIIALLFACLTFFKGLPKALSDRRRSLRQLEESGLLEEALADFCVAEDFGKYGRIGQRFYFGFDTGIVVEIAQISHISKDPVRRRNSSERHSVRCVRMVLITGEEKYMCPANGSIHATRRLQERIDACAIQRLQARAEEMRSLKR